ncbi:ABC transporter substrate-binding protein [Streptomyces collinus]|uniref:caspase, EACC1-associated type n=1 Tax=Streptomyces collinus TaxID=42684 RepID=UPI00380CA1AC
MTELSDPSRSRAVLIGAHAFGHPGLEPLPAVERNLSGLAAVLTDPQVWGLLPEHCRVVSQPVREQALEQVQSAGAEAEDTLLVYYAGHGFVHELSNELYLALPGTDPARLYTALRYQDVREILLSVGIRTRRKVVVLDCCWSGLALHGAMAGGGLGGMSNIEGTFVLTATSETRAALAPPGAQYTAFTGELITALEEGIPHAPLLLTMMTLYRHLRTVLVSRGRPEPQQRNGNTAGSIALARNRQGIDEDEPPAASKHKPKPAPEPEPTPEPELESVPEAESDSAPVLEPEPQPQQQEVQQPAPPSRGMGSPKVRRWALTALAAAATAGAAITAVVPLTLNQEDRKPHGGSNAGGPLHTTDSRRVVKIGLSVTLSNEMGETMRHSARLAVKKANDEGEVPGIRLELEEKDDKGQSATGQQVAQAFVADRDVLATVGPVYDTVALATQKTFADHDLVQVSPSADYPALTLGKRWQFDAKKRPRDTFFSLRPHYSVQGLAAAEYLRKKGWTNAYVLDDNFPYGAALTTAFTERFKKLGGTVSGQVTTGLRQTNFSKETAAVRATSGVEVVYFGGDYETVGRFTKQLNKSGTRIPVVGGDWIFNNAFVKEAGKAAAEGSLTATGGTPPEKSPAGRKFVKEYREAGYKEQPGIFAGDTYDATWAVIQAIKKGVHIPHTGVLPADARSRVKEALQKVSFDGVVGKVAFDKYGRTVSEKTTVFRLENGKWIAQG